MACHRLIEAFALAVVLAAAVSCSEGKYYVSPGGDDRIDAALARIREDRASGKLTGPAEVILSAGEYHIQEPIVFGPADTNITLTGKGMGVSVISGGVTLPPFREEGGIWICDLSGSMIGRTDFGQLYVNGLPATPARTPDAGSFFLTGEASETLLDPVPVQNSPRRGLAVQQVKLSENEMKALENAGPDLSRVRVTFLHSWNLTRRYISSFAADDSLIYVIGSRMQPWNRIDRCSQCYFDNDKSFLDAPGEWFFDKESGRLHYIPREGEDIGTAMATVPVVENFVIIKGAPDARAHDISISGISFRHCGYPMDRKGEDTEQSASSKAASVMVDFADNVKIEDCEISCAGSCGVWWRNSCSSSALTGCYLHDLGIGGVKIGVSKNPADSLLTRFITIDNNIIRSGGRVLETGVGVLLMKASDCRITHNDVSDFFYSGMSIGWQWGYDYSPSKRNDVSYNHIHNIGQGVLSDMGGIYTLGASEGTIVSHNRIHDIRSFGYGGWGLYTDEGSSGIRMECNLVYNCKSSGFHQHFGKDNTIENNIFVNGLDAQLEATRVEDHLSFTFCHNIVCYTTGDMYGKNWNTVNFDSRDNLYWKYGGPVSFNGLTLEEWQRTTGKDSGSVTADPGFRDVASGDFTIADTTVTAGIGFKPFDWGKAGVYGNQSRNLLYL